jgi:hypothetical protein
MKATYCDRCGEDIQTELSVSFYDYGHNEAWFDLCKPCYRKMIKELKVRKKNRG